jgi:transcriptional regulator with XRE-family HTH domain
MELKELVKKARGERTQADIAKQLGVTPQAVSQWETGATNPSPQNLKELGIEMRYVINQA